MEMLEKLPHEISMRNSDFDPNNTNTKSKLKNIEEDQNEDELL